jgi:Asp-tRNA(Asn)/Glu-tRNA(Gln) amidotransferase C subunit
MGQRVNIQYSVDLEDLEMEIVRMVKRVATSLDGIAEELGQAVEVAAGGHCLTLRMLEEVADIRENMMKADYALIDIVNIISSYIHYKSQPEEPTEMGLNMEEIKEKMQQVQAPDAEQLESFIEDFKSSPDANEVSD